MLTQSGKKLSLKIIGISRKKRKVEEIKNQRNRGYLNDIPQNWLRNSSTEYFSGNRSFKYSKEFSCAPILRATGPTSRVGPGPAGAQGQVDLKK